MDIGAPPHHGQRELQADHQPRRRTGRPGVRLRDYRRSGRRRHRSNPPGHNLAWNDWVDPEHPPVRACVQAELTSPGLLVEIMVTAAR